ncbi:MAG: 50S ribosomal protein L6 [Thermoflexales bacterium]|nr:50S ribosomal protein L6 [Thermoflexales bacterium]
MSRIGKMPITVPKGVDIKVDGATVTVKGPKGELKRSFDPRMTIKIEGGKVNIGRGSDERDERSLHGLTRSLLNNMVVGVSEGFNKVLEITQDSVGYRAELKGKDLELFLGFSHSVNFPAPAGISFASDAKTRRITVSGIDKELVGETAALIRKLRPPEPYKGKGIKYVGEVIRRKAGKAGKTGKGAK